MAESAKKDNEKLLNKTRSQFLSIRPRPKPLLKCKSATFNLGGINYTIGWCV